MTVEQNKVLIGRLFEMVFNQVKLEALDEICTPNFVLETPGVLTSKGIKDGVESFKQRIISYSTAFPDIKYTIDNTVAEDTMIAVGFSFSGTHKGEFLGIAPTGKKVTATELCFAHVANGKISDLRFAPYGTPINVLLAA